MNFSITVSLLLSTPAFGFLPNSSFKKSLNTQVRPPSTSLGYSEDVAVNENNAVEWLESPAVGWFFLDDAYTTELKQYLKISEEDIQNVYSSWRMKYNRVADESRYMTFKKNFLMQEEYNKKFKSTFTVNEYADMTEMEYRKILRTGGLVLSSNEK